MISIIIPAYNEERYIEKTISVIQSLIEDNEGIEIVIVNNASKDKTAKIVQGFVNLSFINLEEKVNIGEARNIGVSLSKGEILAFIDADILITDSWIQSLLNFSGFSNDCAPIITGCKVSISKDPSWVEKNWFKWLKTSKAYINSGNLICSRDVFDKLNGFNSALKTGEDVDFCLRAKELKIKIEPNDSFFVYHEGYPKNIGDFFRRERWHGIGDCQSLKLFLGSKIAIMSSIIFLLSLSAFIFFIFGQYVLSGTAFFILILLSVYSLCKRVSVQSVGHLFSSLFLNYIYFIARFCSLFSKGFSRLR